MSTNQDNKYKKLALCLLFDAIGMLSFTIPFIGEFSDIIWAPLAGWLMTRMYKGKIGQGAGLFTFIEEIIPIQSIWPCMIWPDICLPNFKGSSKLKTAAFPVVVL